MITTMDRAGRIVLPKSAREAAGITPGQVRVEVVGTTVTISVPETPLVRRDGLLMLAHGTGLDDEQIRQMRLEPQL